MSTGLCFGANLSGLNLVTKWAVDNKRSACDSLKLNHPETHVRHESANDFLELLRSWDWEKLCKSYVCDLDSTHEFGLDKEVMQILCVFNFEQGMSKKPYARLWWDETVATVVTFPCIRCQAVLHPQQNRFLTIREFARLEHLQWDNVYHVYVAKTLTLKNFSNAAMFIVHTWQNIISFQEK